jgi:hypothetical protein
MVRIVTLFLCIWLVSLSAQDNGKGKGKGQGNQGKAAASSSAEGSSATVVNVSFGTNDVRVIQQYYGAHPVNLPPGLQKKLAKGKPLPPGWQKKLQPFPSDVLGRLNPACGYCGRGVIDGYGVIYDKKTAVILDIVQLVGDILR